MSPRRHTPVRRRSLGVGRYPQAADLRKRELGKSRSAEMAPAARHRRTPVARVGSESHTLTVSQAIP